MYYKRLSVALVAVFALTVILAGCGGESGGKSQNSSSERTQKQESSKGGQTSVQTKIAIGRVAVAGPEGRLVVRLSTGDQSKKRLVFGVAKKAKITLDGKDATLEDAKKGQQAQVKYLVKNDRNRAQEVVLFGQTSPAPSGTTG